MHRLADLSAGPQQAGQIRLNAAGDRHFYAKSLVYRNIDTSDGHLTRSKQTENHQSYETTKSFRTAVQSNSQL